MEHDQYKPFYEAIIKSDAGIDSIIDPRTFNELE